VPRSNKPSSIPAADTEEQRMFFLRILRSHMMLLFLLAFYAGPYNSVRATLEGWRTTIRAEIEAEYKDSTTDACAMERAPVNTALSHDGVRILCRAHVHGITNPAHNARNLARQQQAEEAERGQHLSAEDKLVWARELFRADCAARAIRTSEDAEWHYTRIRDARAAVVRAQYI